MKTFMLLLFAAFCTLPALAQTPEAADSTGLPGDDFSLEGALELFKRNIEMEKFEEELNTDSTHVNNLDLDGNGETDYVRVETQRDGDAVIVVMKVAVSATENQDVAVIEIEKTGEETATLQIIGDEDLYGANTIVEPFAEDEKAAPSKGPRAPALVGVYVGVNVWFWRPIPWCFSPRYYAYSSPWYWGYYPRYWKPWRPHPWRTHWGWCHHYRPWYRPWNSCRTVHAHSIYGPRHARSATVHARYKDAHVRHAARPDRKTDVRPANNPPKGKAAKPAHARPSKAAPKGKSPGGGGKARPARGGGKKGR